MIRKMKNKKGFTLVELIVVIVILGILAAVAVPAYSGYISRSKQAQDNVTLSAVLTAAEAAVADASKGAKTLKSISITNAGVVTITPSEAWGTGESDACTTAFKNYFGSEGKVTFTDTDTYGNSGANWTKDANGVGSWAVGVITG